MIHRVGENESDLFELGGIGESKMNGRLSVPNQLEILRNEILKRSSELFHLHPGRDKMTEEIRKLFLWKGLRKDAFDFASKCLVFQRVKFERQKSS